MNKPRQCPKCKCGANVLCINLSHRFYWVACPKCGRRTIMRQRRDDAVSRWNIGDTYMPGK